MELRTYRSSDCPEIAELFYDTVHCVNAGDYTKDQLYAWADGNVDRAAWDRSFLEHHTVVAVEGKRIIGFGDMDDSGYLDRLYVHKEYQGQGVGTAICGRLEQTFKDRIMKQGKSGSFQRVRFIVHASITARPFFENRGYHVVKEQQVERKGQMLVNYAMERDISDFTSRP